MDKDQKAETEGKFLDAWEATSREAIVRGKIKGSKCGEDKFGEINEEDSRSGKLTRKVEKGLTIQQVSDTIIAQQIF